jgi:precorrin-6A/cobalt-precorrin-6A reductase
MTLLILGGTGEARQIADRLSGYDAVISLAGATRAPKAQGLPVRTGGFGGAEGFVQYLRDAKITAVLDATHPYASRITQRTARICTELGLPYVQVLRPPWEAEAGDQWTEIAHEEDAASHIPKGATVFLGTGRQTLEKFASLQGCEVICRQIDPPEDAFPFAGGRYLVKNAGGAPSRTKLTAARQLGIPVLMVARPKQGDWPVVHDLDAALAWVADL